MTQQARAASLHIDEQDRRIHIHLAYSLLRTGDDGRLFVQRLGNYENKLQLYAREVELKYGLQILSNEPRPGARRADRNELEESRRLGTDVHAIRSAILDSLTKSDNGRSFDAAIKERNWIVAGGDRNCYVVIDEQGGKHALNKKLTGMTLKEIDARLGDLDRTKLPSVDQAQQMQRGRAAQQVQEREKHGRGADAPGQERGRIRRPAAHPAARDKTARADGRRNAPRMAIEQDRRAVRAGDRKSRADFGLRQPRGSRRQLPGAGICESDQASKPRPERGFRRGR